ncbi:hypothetical protein ACJRO7_015333 [Eucalyptus globulus]|uniref:TIR domain-containing protein n=1 Tax=Eucalyptus globulus TaxID=34317 RepID=A0ABD3L383_EUCGL
MVNSGGGTSSGNTRRGQYQVFLNFHGRDTRDGFTGFLHRDLRNNGIHAFIDNKGLRVGEEIGGALLQAIDNSQIYIPIFSPNYASSKWCLRELKRMVDNQSKSKEKKTLPIFYYVKPDDVDLKTESYREAIGELKKEHEKKQQEKFPHKVESWEGESWEEALKKVDKIKGWVLQQGESQAELVDSVVKVVLQELKIRYKFVTKDLVGLDDRVAEVLKLLDVNCSDEVRLVRIHGMGGIGKTTIAKVVYNKLSSRFGKCCAFLDDVCETLKKKGLVWLQKKLLTDIDSSSAAIIIGDVDHGRKMIERTLRSKKVLIVLDDVDEKKQMENLIGQDRLHLGTRIIITTRNTRVLEFTKQRMAPETEEVNSDPAVRILPYEMVMINFDDALQLFKRHAFREDSLAMDFDDLSRDIVSTTGCLPLALEVIGSSLRGEPKAKWENTLKRLRKIPHEDVLERLKISFDTLNDHQRNIFLDIACLFINEDITNAKYMWEACEFYPELEIDVLVTKSLIKIKDDKTFWMHDQLRDLGREIVRRKNPKNFEKQSRVWTSEEFLDFVRTEERYEDVEALDLHWSSDISISHEEIGRFKSLRFLRLSHGAICGDFTASLPKLRWFSWYFASHHVFGPSMHSKNLVVLELFRNSFPDDSKVWDLIKMATKLKNLTLFECHGITRTPDLSKCLDLERLTFHFCRGLKEIDDSIGKLKCLLDLNITHCGLIERVSDEIGGLVKLEHFSLEYCYKLSRLPTVIGDLASLRKLDLSSTGITSLPESIKNLRCLSDLRLRGTKIGQLPNSIGKLTSLCTLDLSKDGTDETIDRWELPKAIRMLDKLEELYLGHRNELVGEIPDEIGHLSSLRVLDLCKTRIYRVPGTIDRLSRLSTLDLTRCDKITELPKLPASLVHLRVRSCSLQVVPNLSKLTNLVELVLSDGSYHQDSSNLKHKCDLGWIGKLTKLTKLELCLLNFDAPPTELGHLSLLENLTLFSLNLQPLEQLPPSLLILKLDNFSSTGPPQSNLEIPSVLMLSFSRLQEIHLYGFSQLQDLHFLFCDLQSLFIPSSLRALTVSACPNMIEIHVLGMSALLKNLQINQCKSIARIVLCGEGESLGVLDQSESSSSESTYCSPGVLLLPNALKKLEDLDLSSCKNLLQIQVISTLFSLQHIFICRCAAMEKLTGISNLKNLRRLFILRCAKLRVIEGLDKLEFLTKLDVQHCPSLETLLDISNSKISDECKIFIKWCRESLDCRESLASSYYIPFKRYKEMMVQQGAPQLETNKRDLNPLSISPLSSTELQLQFHPSASSRDHEINEEPPIDDVRQGTLPRNQNQTREQDLNPQTRLEPSKVFHHYRLCFHVLLSCHMD